MPIKDEIQSTIDTNDVVLFMKGTPDFPQCGFSGQVIQIRLKYTEDRRSAISGLRRVSRPGQRAYVPAKQVPKVRNGLGISIISTSQGVMTDKEARTKGVGGEVLCEVW